MNLKLLRLNPHFPLLCHLVYFYLVQFLIFIPNSDRRIYQTEMVRELSLYTVCLRHNKIPLYSNCKWIGEQNLEGRVQLSL